RAEFFAILQQIIVYPPSGEAPVVFADVTESDWFYGIFQSLIAAGMVEPIEGFVDPNRPLTRQEEAFFLAKAFNIPPVADETAFADDGDIGAWSKGYVKALNELGIIKGYETEEGQMFRPSNSITRAEAVVIIELVAQNLINAPGEYSDNVEGALVINCSGVKLTGMTVSGDLYLTGGAADTILDNVSISGELIVLNAGS
ncbi:MAG: S-layer homology domain-containing protein, partial [Clostridiales bacterium]|nr:S-layer homology domain-containing protein [Clostridiales bacterium]